MTRIRLVVGSLGTVTLVALQACSAPADPSPDPVAQTSDALSDDFAVAMEEPASGDQGGCSNGEIRGCVSECYGKYPSNGGRVLECRKVCNIYGCYNSCFCG